MTLLLAWVKKKLGVISPSFLLTGYEYEYDMLKARKKGR